MSIYPSLEDMKIDQLMQAQKKYVLTSNNVGYQAKQGTSPIHTSPSNQPANVYPALRDFMGLDLSAEMIAQNMPEHSQVTSSELQVSCKKY